MMKFEVTNKRYHGVLSLAENCVETGDLRAAAQLAQIAARYAFPGNAGQLASPRLEQLLISLGRQLPVTGDKLARPGQSKHHVLHVLSHGRPVGGDTRFVWRMIEEDKASTHSVAITAQSEVAEDFAVPPLLRGAVEASGGFFWLLDGASERPLEKAAQLRRMCQCADKVLLHAFPYDVIPIIALAAGCGSTKVLLVNHADHTFWVGASVSHVVVHLRSQPHELLALGRGLKVARSALLPIPLPACSRAMSNAEAKRRLGYAKDVTLLLTIASPFKFQSQGSTGLLDLVLPLLSERRDVVLIGVGPEPTGAWTMAHSVTGGRVVAIGTRWDTDLFYAAADIYLDSVPFSSITSLLEAANHGIPLLGFRSDDEELLLLGPGAPGLDDVMELARTPQEYRGILERLIVDPEFRRASGERIQQQVHRLHTGAGWLSALYDVYAKVEHYRTRGCFTRTHDVYAMSRMNATLFDLYGQTRDARFVSRLIAKHVGALNYGSRIGLSAKLYKKGFPLCIGNFLPPRLERILRGALRRHKRVSRAIEADLYHACAAQGTGDAIKSAARSLP
jgi:hypothetical protein